MGNSATAFYLYCLTPAECAAGMSVIGVDGQRPATLSDFGGIGAVLSEVELKDFCGESAETRLQDLAWLGPRAFRHEAVVEEVMSRSAVLPARFATLFSSRGSLERSILENQKSIADFFARLDDKQEWAVKGFLNRAEAIGTAAFSVKSTAPEEAVATSPGFRYFEDKRIQARLERDFKSCLKEFCRHSAVRLRALADDFQERAILGPGAGRTGIELLLNWAFLVSPSAIEDFRIQLDLLNCEEAFRGLSLTLTGPWPPYSFAPNLTVNQGMGVPE